MDRSSLSAHAARAHYHKCGFGQKNEATKIQFPRHRLVDSKYCPSASDSIHSFNFRTVVWNPWADQAREIADFGDDEYPNMLCVEAGHVSSPVILLPGTAFEASQILQVSIIVFTINRMKYICCVPFIFIILVGVSQKFK